MTDVIWNSENIVPSSPTTTSYKILFGFQTIFQNINYLNDLEKKSPGFFKGPFFNELNNEQYMNAMVNLGRDLYVGSRGDNLQLMLNKFVKTFRGAYNPLMLKQYNPTGYQKYNDTLSIIEEIMQRIMKTIIVINETNNISNFGKSSYYYNNINDDDNGSF